MSRFLAEKGDCPFEDRGTVPFFGTARRLGLNDHVVNWTVPKLVNGPAATMGVAY
jgi:hypothetical protein